MLGSGRADLEAFMRATEAANPARFRGWVGFSVPVAHRITAGCDILLMPSRFEPCGLIQLHAMQYGTVPIVASTGGLVDTVKEATPLPLPSLSASPPRNPQPPCALRAWLGAAA